MTVQRGPGGPTTNHETVRPMCSLHRKSATLPLCMKVFFDRLPKDGNIIDRGIPYSFDVHSLVIVDQDVAHTSRMSFRKDSLDMP